MWKVLSPSQLKGCGPQVSSQINQKPIWLIHPLTKQNIFQMSKNNAPDDEYKNKDVHVARNGVTGAPPWSQAWGWGSQLSAWWPGLSPWDLAVLSPKE